MGPAARRNSGSGFKSFPWAHLDNVDLLTPFVGDPKTLEERNPDPQIVSYTFDWEVEDIIDSPQVKEKSQFLVKWKDYGENSSSWEPEENLQYCSEVLGEFLARGSLPLGGGSVRNVSSENSDNNLNS
ncbi:hypothetical protein DSO57_1020338, partial [Entomophthora muscae]